ncbi:PEP-CTERM sorting domain-containing protein [Gemmatimonas sp.]|jgi:hypothetical protein|uniref:WD40/YVTN/BNR-like repeat-containing protein n=1 Tax=Gemmatimonas sp. TaxID=1962908 RepID=UPI0022C81ACF|nr:PEP-CTERM sorting domain-containing protein [Gemmatimonas sp.]MCZ8203792.1 PEP-CTERM sorting domain-containing protein [Gemmatimonas sp.]
MRRLRPSGSIMTFHKMRLVFPSALLLLASLAPAARAQTVTLLPALPFDNSFATWGTSPNNVWAAGGVRGIARFDGTTWTSETVTTGFNRYTVFGTATGTMYSSGQLGYQSGALLRRNASATWSPVFTASTELVGLWAGDDGSVLVAGDGRFFYSPDGTTFLEAPTGLSSAFNIDRLETIWGRSASDAYIVGRGGLYRWDGAAFSRVNIAATALNSVHYSGASWWAVGNGGQVWRGNGATWNSVDMGTTNDILSVWAYSDADVWVSGVNGMLRHFDGTSWRAVASGTNDPLGRLHAVDNSTLFVGSSSNPGLVRRIDVPRAAVPEPSSLALVAAGAAALALRRQRTRLQHGRS